MVGKVVVSGMSLILVVGVALAVVAVINKGNKSEATDDLSPKMKSVQTICMGTDYKKECQNTLANIAHNASSDDPREYVKAAILATMDEVTKGLNLTDTLMVEAKNNASIKMSVDDCKDLLQFAIESLQASYSTVGDPNVHTDADRIDDLKTWLSSVVSFQESCKDGLGEFDVELKQKMQDGLDVAGKLTSNALAIVDEVSELLESIGMQLKVKPANRKLLGATEVGRDGIPIWLSGGDRRLLAGARGGSAQVKPNVVVAKDGSGQFKTINAALNAYPKNLAAVIGAGFLCKSMGFQNTAGPEGHQAVALRSQSEKSAFFNCRMDGYQDTLYVQANRQFYRNCVISGTVDFIFGDSNTIIQNSLIIVRRPMDNQQNTVTANGRKYRQENSGLVIHNCRIVPEQKLFAERLKIPTYLGRPWKEHARTVIMESTLGDLIQPAGYLPWAGSFALSTCQYLEYANRGPGANTNRRVRWKGVRVIGRNEALQFTAAPFLLGKTWLQGTGGQYFMGLRN